MINHSHNLTDMPKRKLLKPESLNKMPTTINLLKNSPTPNEKKKEKPNDDISGQYGTFLRKNNASVKGSFNVEKFC